GLRAAPSSAPSSLERLVRERLVRERFGRDLRVVGPLGRRGARPQPAEATNASTASAIICTASAARRNPANRETMIVPDSLRIRLIAPAKRIESHSMMHTATSATPTEAHCAGPSAPVTNTIVATIAPGPASNGVPSGTSATLTDLFGEGSGSSILPVSS